MNELRSLSAAELLGKCPQHIKVGNWDDAWQEIRRRVLLLEQHELDAGEGYYE